MEPIPFGKCPLERDVALKPMRTKLIKKCPRPTPGQGSGPNAIANAQASKGLCMLSVSS